MAYRYQNDSHVTGRTPSYYANNKLYKDSYTRNEWQTRTSRRVHDGLSLPMNYGLDTVTDDINSSPYSSPYYINGRFNTQNVSSQRSSSASIQGVKKLLDAAPLRRDTVASIAKASDLKPYNNVMRLWQGKQIKFEMDYDGKIVGNTIFIRNTEFSTGILSIYLSAEDGGVPIYETAIDLCTVSQDVFEKRDLFSITTVPATANLHKKIYVRMEIWDEVDKKRSANPFNTGKAIELLATGDGDHYECIYRLGDKNVPVKEQYNYVYGVNRPILGFIYSDYTSIPVNRHEEQDSGAFVSLDGYKYGVFAYKDSNDAFLALYDFQTNKMVDTTIPVDVRAKEINIVQAVKDLYIVDGYSTLKRVEIGDWSNVYEFPTSETDSVSVAVDVTTFAASELGQLGSGAYVFTYDAKYARWDYTVDSETKHTTDLASFGITLTGDVSDNATITITYYAAGTVTEASADAAYSDARPVVAASIICKHNNRIYLGGFKNDPNLIQCSRITAEGPDYSNYPYRFYVPDNSPYATSTNTVTAIVQYETDTLMILCKNSFSLYTSNVNIEDGTPEQVSTYMDSGGAQSAGDVVNYDAVIYSFDIDEGIRRFTGSIWQKIPASVDSLVDRVDMDKPRKLWGYAHRIYFNYTDKVDGKYKCLIWDSDMNYQQYPWFQDYDLPFCDVRFDDDFDIVGIHPDYPVIMSLYAEDTWRRLDSPIVFERHTKHLSLPGNASNMRVNRIHNKVIANSDRWWWFGISYDANEWTQYRGNDSWYRFPVWDTIEVDQPAEFPFPIQDTYEEKAVALLTISNIRIKGISMQEKIKCKTFRTQANLVSILLESEVRNYN